MPRWESFLLFPFFQNPQAASTRTRATKSRPTLKQSPMPNPGPGIVVPQTQFRDNMVRQPYSTHIPCVHLDLDEKLPQVIIAQPLLIFQFCGGNPRAICNHTRFGTCLDTDTDLEPTSILASSSVITSTHTRALCPIESTSLRCSLTGQGECLGKYVHTSIPDLPDLPYPSIQNGVSKQKYGSKTTFCHHTSYLPPWLATT